ncbi:MAG TPA: hypothetical protein VMM93_12780 [Vicinamibacterales bacterium]|nr:hypothetical protein [Vicinamibacterales bacterium]
MSRQITPSTTLDALKTEARRWLKAIRAGAGHARPRLARAMANPPTMPTLRDVQHALAREHGLPGWTALKDRLSPASPMRRYDTVAEALVVAYRTGEREAMRIVRDFFGHGRTWEVTRRYIRLALGRPEAEPETPDEIGLEEARFLVARAQEFESWEALERHVAALPRGRTIIAKPVAMYATSDAADEDVATRSRDWDEVTDLMRARRLERLHAVGQMTDAVLDRVSRLDHITRLDLGGSKALTDEGLRYLARLPNLRHLNLGGCTGITDAGLQVLRHLPALEAIELTWTRITDDGVAHLSVCERLRAVDLSATRSGDGAIRALAGKVNLADLRTGIGVTDAGLALLHELPSFRQWRGGEPRMSLLGFDAGPTFLMLRGPFTDAGFGQLVGLDGLFALNVDDARLAISGAALAPLVELPHLEWLAFDAKDESMPSIAALPRLRFLMCQDTSAGDDGFEALSRSRTIEHIWGRRCYNLQRRGFVAMADMPALAHLSVSCRNVDDEGLSALPRFPALRELMPMDVPDAGYRHVGHCRGIESLVLMYCRDTGDEATSHITDLPRLQKYFASYNRITDRTPELLAGIPTLEEVTFDTCTALTDAGVAALARLPRLRRLRVSGMRHVTPAVADAFVPGMRVSHGT